MTQFILVNDDGTIADVTEEIETLMTDNEEMFEELGTIQASHELVLARGAQSTGASAEVGAAARAKGRVAPRAANPSTVAASRAAGKTTVANVAAKAPKKVAAAATGGMGGKVARATTLGKKLGHVGKVAMRFGKKHPAVAAAAGAAAGAGAVNALRSKMQLSQAPLELEEALLEDPETEEVYFEDMSEEEQNEFLETCDDDDLQAIYEQMSPEDQDAYDEQIRVADLQQFASTALLENARGRTPAKK